MTSLSEQLSAVRKSQVEAQLDLMSALTSQAFRSASQVIALNFDTSRASVERSATALRQLLSLSDPRDLFALNTHTQEQVQQMLAYGRDLFNIASGARLDLQRQLQAQTAAQPVTEPAEVAAPAEAAVPAQAVAPTEAVAPAEAAISAAADVAETAAEGIAPPAEPKPIAKAVRKVAAKRSEVPRPLASEIAVAPKEVVLPKLQALEASPPPPAAQGKPALEVKQAALPGIKAPRKSTRK